jgi:hypothetical protein
LDVSSNKLKQGYGEEVCTVLFALCDISVKNKIRFKKPVIKDEGGGFGDEDADDLGDEFEGHADIADAHHDAVQSDDDEIEDDLDFGGHVAQPKVNEEDLLQ